MFNAVVFLYLYVMCFKLSSNICTISKTEDDIESLYIQIHLCAEKLKKKHVLMMCCCFRLFYSTALLKVHNCFSCLVICLHFNLF